jgi:hypothetical protein
LGFTPLDMGAGVCSIEMCRFFASIAVTATITAATGIVPVFGSESLPPRIDSVVMLEIQPHADDPATIWYDDFTEARVYGEATGIVDFSIGYGGRGGSLPMIYEEGSRGRGDRKVFFGDNPDGRTVVRAGEQFRDVYWRFYVKHQHGWTGNPAKMSRANALVSSDWRQGMIAHLWDGGDSLMIDPATGIRNSTVATTRYNDFENLDWMGARARASFPLHSTQESGYWVPVEARARLNTPGSADGVFKLWINGRLEAALEGLDWHGGYIEHGINAVFLESYWNDRSPVSQRRWFDNFVISTAPIGPVRTSRNPEVIKSLEPGARTGIWQVEAAKFDDMTTPVWRSHPVVHQARVRIDAEEGRFENGGSQLAADARYFLRIRRQSASGRWSDWSHWHQPFRTAPAGCLKCPLPPFLETVDAEL